MHKNHSARLLNIKVISVALDLLTISLTFLAVTLMRKTLGGEFAPTSLIAPIFQYDLKPLQ